MNIFWPSCGLGELEPLFFQLKVKYGLFHASPPTLGKILNPDQDMQYTPLFKNYTKKLLKKSDMFCLTTR